MSMSHGMSVVVERVRTASRQCSAEIVDHSSETSVVGVGWGWERGGSYGGGGKPLTPAASVNL